MDQARPMLMGARAESSQGIVSLRGSLPVTLGSAIRTENFAFRSASRRGGAKLRAVGLEIEEGRPVDAV